MMLQGVSLSLTAWGRYHNDWGGQMLVVFIITVAACEAGIALALVLMPCQRCGSLDILSWQKVREEGQPAYVDEEVLEEIETPDRWPTLTPAGVEPEIDQHEHLYRNHV